MLTVVVTVVSDTSEQADTLHLEGCLEALRQQVNPPAMEVLVTCDARLPGIKDLEHKFPDFGFIAVEKLHTARSGPSREHHDELRGIGMRTGPRSADCSRRGCWAARSKLGCSVGQGTRAGLFSHRRSDGEWD